MNPSTVMLAQFAVALCFCLGATTAFTVSSSQVALRRSVLSVASSSIEPEGATKDGIAIMKELGIEEGKLALGIKPSEIQKYIGTRAELIEKTLADVPKFDGATAETEVDKFLIDSEMVNLYIRYQKEVE